MATSTEVTAWPHLYTPGREDAPVLLMLHGTGSNARDIGSLAGTLGADRQGGPVGDPDPRSSWPN
jgi:phospholipase/carboxylesterase